MSKDQLSKDLNFNQQVFNQSQLISKLEDTVYQLEWSVRDKLIVNINQHSQFLICNTISSDIKKTLKKRNIELFSILSNLKLKSNDDNEQINANYSNANHSNANHSNANHLNDDSSLNVIVLDLDFKTRKNIIDSLATNQSFAILHVHLISDEIKKELINNNKMLINTLINLPTRLVKAKSLDQDSNMSDEGEMSTNLAEHELINQICKLKREVTHLNDFTNELRFRVEDMDYNRFETLFTYQIDDIRTFEEIGETQSTSFFCGGVSWHVGFYLTKRSKDKPTYVSIYLNPDNTECFHWKIKTDFTIAILNQQNKQDKIKRFSDKIFHRNDFGWGEPKFLKLEKLKRNGFVKENAFVVQVRLLVGKTI